jgi:hypothetical protein
MTVCLKRTVFPHPANCVTAMRHPPLCGGSRSFLRLLHHAHGFIRLHLATSHNAPKLAKDVIEYFMEIALRYAQAYAPTDADLSFDPKPEVQAMRDWKRNQFKMWAGLAAAWASDLAPYQSPTFRAISISPAQDDRPKVAVVMHTIEQVREQLILRGVPPDQLGRALIGPPPMIEHDDHGEKKR